ncbi:hypothetical protein MTO96_000968 [Rhipicephalus appendiculatus]
MWTVRLEGGPRRVNHAAVAINGKVYSFGGYCTGEDYNTRKPIDVHVLNTVSLRWALVQTQSHPDDVPFQRYGHTVMAYGDYAYLWGGRNDDGACNVLYRFDTNTLTWSRPKVCGHVPGARDGHSACVMGNRMYVFGGFEEQADRFSQDVHYLDLGHHAVAVRADQGEGAQASPPQWRDFHSASAIGGRIHLVLGAPARPRACPLRDAGATRPLCTMESCTSLGGYNGLLLTHFGDMHKYDPESSCWSQVKIQREGPCARRRQCCCMVGDRLFLFGGTSPTPNQVARQRMEEFDANDLTLMDHSDLHVLDFDARMDISHLPQDIRWEISAMTTNNSISRPSQTTG